MIISIVRSIEDIDAKAVSNPYLLYVYIEC